VTGYRLSGAAPVTVLFDPDDPASVRILRPLAEAHIGTVAQLLLMDAHELARLPGMGPPACAEVRSVLKRHGLSLAPVDPYKAGLVDGRNLPPLSPDEARRAVQVTGGPLSQKRDDKKGGSTAA
jgi:hypothetical protein